MEIRDAALTCFYFFRAGPEREDWQNWCRRLAGRLNLQRHHEQSEVWRDQARGSFLDVVRAESVVLVRLSLSHTGWTSLTQWSLLWRRLMREHIYLRQGGGNMPTFMGCSLLFWGMRATAEQDDPAAWLSFVPVRQPMPAPYQAHIKCGQLWQIQSARADVHDEAVYAILVPEDQEQDVNYQLVYNDAFWQAEAVRHQVDWSWNQWKMTGQIEGRQQLSTLYQELDPKGIHSDRGALSDSAWQEIHQAYELLARCGDAVVELDQYILESSYRYQALLESLVREEDAGNLVSAAQSEFDMMRRLLKSELGRYRWALQQIANALDLRHIWLVIKQTDRRHKPRGWFGRLRGWGRSLLRTWHMKRCLFET